MAEVIKNSENTDMTKTDTDIITNYDFNKKINNIKNNHISHSRVETYKSCPYRYKLSYIDDIHCLPEFDRADNALYLGTCIHRAIELNNTEKAIEEYFNTYPIIDESHETESLKMELILEKTLQMIPSGKHEVELAVNDRGINFLGYIDLLTDSNDIWDFKYSNNINHYLESGQLSLYKYFASKLGYNINNLYFLFIPKLQIKKMITETEQQYRNRIIEESKKLQPVLTKVEYQQYHIDEFFKTIDEIKNTTEEYKNGNKNIFIKKYDMCFFCGYKKYCESEGEINYMITLPENKRRDISKISKRKLWVYGAPFTGKTSFLDKCPDPLSLNTDGNISFVTMAVMPIKDGIKTDGRLVNRTFAWQIFKDTIEELEKKQNGFKTIIIDLIDDIREYCRLYEYDKLKIAHESDSGFGKGYDMIKTEFLSTMKRFFNLPYENLVIVSHEDTSRDITKKSGQNITRIAPNIQQALANKLAGMVDIVARVVVEEDGSRTLNFKSDEVVFGGGRLKGLKTTKIPLDWDAFVKVYDEATGMSNSNNVVADSQQTSQADSQPSSQPSSQESVNRESRL